MPVLADEMEECAEWGAGNPYESGELPLDWVPYMFLGVGVMSDWLNEIIPLLASRASLKLFRCAWEAWFNLRIVNNSVMSFQLNYDELRHKMYWRMG
jgi:hypothetical protein